MTEEATPYVREPSRDVIELPQRNQVMTPMDMIGQAVANGAGIDVLEKLMSLQERYDASQAKKAYSAAMADAKAEIKPIVKNRKVDFKNKNNEGRTNYEYEDLAGIADVIDPILSKFGLSYRWRSSQNGNKLTIICVMSHRDGYSEDAAELSADNDTSGNKNSIQAVGSTATFLQRYTLKLAVGLAASKDDDGNSADVGKLITDKQCDELLALAEAAGADKKAFCDTLKVQGFAQIPASRFFQAKSFLQAKMLKERKDAENA